MSVHATTGDASASPATRAALGAALLDEQRPGWALEVSRRSLEMQSPCRCVLGQVYGYYTWGLRELDLDDGYRAAVLGFTYANAGSLEWEALDAAWEIEVRVRQAATRGGRADG